nr:unnamed protein product [uncultured bacterium]
MIKSPNSSMITTIPGGEDEGLGAQGVQGAGDLGVGAGLEPEDEEQCQSSQGCTGKSGMAGTSPAAPVSTGPPPFPASPMLFNSYAFLLFFPTVLMLYWAVWFYESNVAEEWGNAVLLNPIYAICLSRYIP